MAAIGTMTVHFYGRVGASTPPRRFEGVPKRQYAKLSSELMSGGGYHAFQITTATGMQSTLDKRAIASVDFEPTGYDDSPEDPPGDRGITYHHPRGR